VAGLLIFLRVRKVSVSGVESQSDVLSKIFTCFLSLKIVIFDLFKIKIVDNKTSWHNVILINMLNKWFNTSSFDEFLLRKTSLDLSGVASNTSYQKMRESMLLNDD